MFRIMKWIMALLLGCVVEGCADSNKPSENKPEKVELDENTAANEEDESPKDDLKKYRQSSLENKSYEITKFSDGGGFGSPASFSVEISDETRNEYSDIVLLGTVKEVESYAQDGAVKSDIYLSVEKVLKNETDLKIGDEFSFLSRQGIVP